MWRRERRAEGRRKEERGEEGNLRGMKKKDGRGRMHCEHEDCLQRQQKRSGAVGKLCAQSKAHIRISAHVQNRVSVT